MRAYSDTTGSREQMQPEWDVQAARLGGRWIIAIGDHDDSPLMKDIAVFFENDEQHEEFEGRLNSLWQTWGG
eukprot:6505672-Alexandrium_andersonii.AAC.1